MYALSSFRALEPSRENRNRLSKSLVVPIDHSSFGESASPFIDEGDCFTRERESVCYLVLSTPLGTRWFVGAHNTVDG